MPHTRLGLATKAPYHPPFHLKSIASLIKTCTPVNMHFTYPLLLVAALVTHGSASRINLQDRQVPAEECEERYGTYPEYKGPCSEASTYVAIIL